MSTLGGRLHLTGPFQDESGDVQSGVSFTVQTGGSPATGYTNAALTVGAASVFTASALGLPPAYYFTPGEYLIVDSLGVTRDSVTVNLNPADPAIGSSLTGGTTVWSATTAIPAGIVDGGDGNLYLAPAAYTSGASVAADVTALHLAQTGIKTVQTVAQALQGITSQPWRRSVAVNPELWTLATFQVGGGFNSSTLAPSLTANSSAQTSKTRIYLGNLVNQDTPFRWVGDITSVPANGWWTVSLLLTDSGGTALAGTTEQIINSTGDPAGHRIIEFLPISTGDVYLETRVAVFNNATSGTLSIANVSVRETAHVTRPLFAVKMNSVTSSIVQQLRDPIAGVWRWVRTLIGADSALNNGITNIDAWADDQIFQHRIFDPAFALSTGDVTGDTTGGPVTETARSLRINNNDQILEVLGSDAVTWTLRGNTHGGETNTTTAVLEWDDGTGTWTATPIPSTTALVPGYRFRMTWPTKMTRPAPDSDDFATVTHVSTWFPDGVMRQDRTTTFTKAVSLRYVFEWMSSHDTSTPAIGRIGRGLIVIDEVDTFPKVASPTSPTVGTATSGGTLAPGTYLYAVTAVTEAGETTPTATVSQATTGSTSTVTVGWTPSSGATGYRIYGRAAGRLALLATVGPGATSYVDTGSAAAFGTPIPTVNRARQLGATSIANDAAESGTAYWTVWYDPVANMCIANVFDRDSVLTRSGVASAKLRLEGITGSIRKSYLNTFWGDTGTHSTTIGESWTATHWTKVYIPQDPANYHLETALFASDLTALKTNYPST